MHHTRTTPPRTAEYHEVVPRFVVPESKRAEVGKAACPICSPVKPKYFEGALAYFPDEGVLRAIGHECATSHFGAASVARSKVEGQRRRAETYLLDAVPQGASLKERARRLPPIAAAMDQMRSALHRSASKTAWGRLARIGVGGSLPIEESQEVHTVDALGRSSTRQISRVVDTIRVDGVGFIAENRSTVSEAQNAVAAAELIATCGDDEVVDFIIALSPQIEDLLALERLLRTTRDAVELLERKIVDAHQFLSAGNLSALSRWTGDRRVQIGLEVSFSPVTPHQLRVRMPRRDWRTLTIPETLRANS